MNTLHYISLPLLFLLLYYTSLYYTIPQARLKRIRKQEEYLANQRRLEGFANGTDHDRDAEGEGDGAKEGEKEVVRDTTSPSKNKEEAKDTHTILTRNTQNNHTLSDKMPTPPPASTPPFATSTSPAASPQVSPRPPPPLHFSQETTHHIPTITCPNDFI